MVKDCGFRRGKVDRVTVTDDGAGVLEETVDGAGLSQVAIFQVVGRHAEDLARLGDGRA
jgi:hypothetical protein